MAIQSEQGKAFEFACLNAIYEMLASPQYTVNLVIDSPFRTARNAFSLLDDQKQNNLVLAGRAGARVLMRAEPRLSCISPNEQLTLQIQTDAAGIRGDVRDILCIKSNLSWSIGISCKHNHAAVKHSRLSQTINFGNEWFGFSCSQNYFSQISPIFSYLDNLRHQGALWSSIEDKESSVYIPILKAFIEELRRLSVDHPNLPELLVEYLIGNQDFYKIIAIDNLNSTRIQAFNFLGTLNQSYGSIKPSIRIPQLRLPTRFYNIDFKKNSRTTIEVVFDNGWQISLRIHNASSRVEPSLKFDVQLISTPHEVFYHDEPWIV